jgi:hypothetical protein
MQSLTSLLGGGGRYSRFEKLAGSGLWVPPAGAQLLHVAMAGAGAGAGTFGVGALAVGQTLPNYGYITTGGGAADIWSLTTQSWTAPRLLTASARAGPGMPASLRPVTPRVRERRRQTPSPPAISTVHGKYPLRWWLRSRLQAARCLCRPAQPPPSVQIRLPSTRIQPPWEFLLGGV